MGFIEIGDVIDMENAGLRVVVVWRLIWEMLNVEDTMYTNYSTGRTRITQLKAWAFFLESCTAMKKISSSIIVFGY